MRKLFFLFLLLSGASKVIQAQITWNFTAAAATGAPANSTSGSVTQGNNNGTTTFLAAGIPASAVYSGFSGGFNGNCSAKIGALSLATSTYVQAVITPVAGYWISITGISWGNFSLATTGPTTLSVYSSNDNFATSTLVATSTVTQSATAWTQLNPVITPITGLTATAITIRIYASGGTGTTPAAVNWRVDDLVINATAQTGSTGQIPKFTGSSTFANSIITENNNNIGIGTLTPAAKLDIAGNLKFTGTLLAGATPTAGTSGQVLQSTGLTTAPIWVTPAAGGTTLNGTGYVKMAGATANYIPLIPNVDLANTAVASLSGANTGDNAPNTLYSGLISNATHTGDVSGSTILTVNGIKNVAIPALSTGNLRYNGTAWVFDNTALTSFTETDPIVKAINGLVKSNGTTIAAAIAGTDYLTPTGSAAGLTSFPTFNQNTTGSAATITGAITESQVTNLVSDLAAKQALLVSGTNVKTVNGMSILGTGNIAINTTETDPVVKAVTGLVKSNGTTISAATAGTDYLTPTGSAGGLTSFPTLNQNTTGTAASITGNVTQNQVTNLTTDLAAKQALLLSGTNIKTVNGATILGSGDIVIATPSETDPIVKAVNGLVKSNGTTISAATAGTDYLTPSGSAAGLMSFPILNQNTTGTAASITGNVTQNQVTNLTTDLAAKQNNITLTTTGTNGFATLSGSTLNIPNYAGNITSTAWGLQGNAATTPGTNYIGTTDLTDLIFKTNNTEKFKISSTGKSRFYYNNWNAAGGNNIFSIGDSTYNIFDVSTTGTDAIFKFRGNNPGYNDTWSFNIEQGYNTKFRSGIYADYQSFNFGPNETVRFLQNGSIGIGTTTTAAKLDIAGNIKITDGTQGINKVLTSDANGLASWAALPTVTNTGWGLTGNAGTTAATNFIGTTDNNALTIKLNSAAYGTLNHIANNNILGVSAGSGATGISHSNFFGNNAGFGAIAAIGANFLGLQSGSGASTSSYSNFLGYTAGLSANASPNSNFIGYYAGRQANTSPNSNFIGNTAGTSATNSSNSNFIGTNAGNVANLAAYSNFIGFNAGNGANGSTYSNLIGYNAGKRVVNNNIGTNNIIIGTNITLPSATTNAMNIGGVLYGMGLQNDVAATNPYETPKAGAKIGIGLVSPAYTLDVNGITNTLGLRMPTGAATGMVLTSDATGTATWATLPSAPTTGWGLTGNAGTTPGANFIGTTDNKALIFKIKNVESGRLDSTNTSYGYATSGNIGDYVTAIGAYTANGNTGNYVTAIGPNSAGGNSGSNVIAIGSAAGGNIGSNVIASGSSAAKLNTGSNVIAIGNDAANSNTGNLVTAIGDRAAYNNTKGFITTIGTQAAEYNTGEHVTAIGIVAANSNTGNLVTAIGDYAAQNNTGQNVTATGVGAASNNTGNELTANGYNAAQGNTGHNVTATGFEAAQVNTGQNVTATGIRAALNNKGNDVIAIGLSAARDNTENDVVANGIFAASGNTGTFVTAIGNYAAQNNTKDKVTAIGQLAANGNTGGNVTATGIYAAQNNSGFSVTASGVGAALSNSGSDVVAIGQEAARNNTGNLVTAIGNGAAFGNTKNNITAIGAYSTVTVDNAISLGSINGINGATADVNVGIGTTAPTAQLHTTKDVRFGKFKNNNAMDSVLTTDTSGNLKLKYFVGGTGGVDNSKWTLVGNNIYSRDSANVGIGVNNATAKLHAKGTIRFESLKNNAAKDSVLTTDSSGNLSMKYLSADNSKWRLIGNNIYSRDSAYVGIGTDSATAKFHALGTIRFESFKNNPQGDSVLTTDQSGNLKMVYLPYGSGGGGGASYTFKNGVTQSNGIVNIGGSLEDTVNLNLAGYNFNINNGTQKVLTASSTNNNIGVGTAPVADYRMSVNGDANIGNATSTTGMGNKLWFNGTGNGDNIWMGRFNTAASNTDLRINIGNGAGISNDRLDIGYDSANNWNSKFVVQNNGMVGIGTTQLNGLLSIGSTHGNKLSIGNNAWAKTSIINTGNNANADGDFTDLLVAGQNNNNAVLRMNSKGNVGIGTSVNTALDSTYRLSVNGKIRAKGLRVQTTGWADFVFEPGYKLKSLIEVEAFINKNKHLPEMLPAQKVIAEGNDVGETQVKLLQKVEELTLYLIDQDKQLKKLQEQNKALETQNKEIENLKKQMDELKALLQKSK